MLPVPVPPAGWADLQITCALEYNEDPSEEAEAKVKEAAVACQHIISHPVELATPAPPANPPPAHTGLAPPFIEAQLLYFRLLQAYCQVAPLGPGTTRMDSESFRLVAVRLVPGLYGPISRGGGASGLLGVGLGWRSSGGDAYYQEQWQPATYL